MNYLARLKELDAQSDDCAKDPAAQVEALYAQMAADYARRRDWYARPVEGERDRLTWRNCATGNVTTIELRNRKERK